MTARRIAMALAVMLPLAVPAPSAAAQQEVPRAHVHLRAGRVSRAEALYFLAARRRPRDPEARFALGEYLASRGASRVGAVLIEEARRFGGDSARAAALLAPIYARLEDFAALTQLAHARLAPGELARARWLQANGPTIGGPDSVTLPLIPTATSSAFGAIRLIVAGDTVRAEIDPSASGLMLDQSHARSPGIRTFDAAGAARQPAIVTRALLGPFTLRNAPVTLVDLGGAGRAKVGLDWIARWAPTIDPGFTRTITLRRSGRIPRDVAARATSRVPLLLSIPGSTGMPIPGPWVAVPGGLARLGAAEVSSMRVGRVSLDSRRGELLIDR